MSEKRFDFDWALEDCLTRIYAGQSLEECLVLYPVQAELLQPLLAAALKLHATPAPAPSPEAVLAGRQRMLAAAAQKQAEQKNVMLPVSSGFFSRYTQQMRQTWKSMWTKKEKSTMNLTLRWAFGLLLALLVGGTLAVNASAQALPGDPLYGVKLAWEDTRLALTLQEQAREQLAGEIQLERQSEIRSMIQQNRTGEVEFVGMLQVRGDEELKVGEFQMRMMPETEMETGLQAGELVRVKVRVLNNGELTALKIQNAGQNRTRFNQPTRTVTVTPGTGNRPSETPKSSQQPTHTPPAGPKATEAPGGEAPGPKNSEEPPKAGPGPGQPAPGGPGPSGGKGPSGSANQSGSGNGQLTVLTATATPTEEPQSQSGGPGGQVNNNSGGQPGMNRP
jgi:hypothetical protein